MRPTQLGFAIKGGAEAAVHAARSFLERNQDNIRPQALFRVDVKNAFNSLDRTRLLKAVKENCRITSHSFFNHMAPPRYS